MLVQFIFLILFSLFFYFFPLSLSSAASSCFPTLLFPLLISLLSPSATTFSPTTKSSSTTKSYSLPLPYDHLLFPLHFRPPTPHPRPTTTSLPLHFPLLGHLLLLAKVEKVERASTGAAAVMDRYVALQLESLTWSSLIVCSVYHTRLQCALTLLSQYVFLSALFFGGGGEDWYLGMRTERGFFPGLCDKVLLSSR